MNAVPALAVVEAPHECNGAERCGVAGGLLTSLANRPLLWHILDRLSEAGIETAAIVADARLRDRVQTVAGTSTAPALKVEFLDPGDRRSPQEPLDRLKRWAGLQPVLLHPGDRLFLSALPRLCECFAQTEADLAVLPPAPAHDPVPISGIQRAVPLPAGTAAIAAPAAWPALEALAGGPITVSGLLDAAVAVGAHVVRCEAGEQWHYSDRTAQLLAANRMILDRMAPGAPPSAASEPRSEVHGLVAIDETARVSGSSLAGPSVVGAGAVLSDSFIGPYTAIGDGATVVGAEVQNAIVLAGAEIRHPGVRVEGSVIGEAALVTRSFGFPTGLHLHVGPRAQVIIG
ncbi:MAG: hypothetical protein ACRDL5_04720 [Solirubrobacteraceae bacterium]